MNNWKFIIAALFAILVGGIESAFGQDSTSQSRVDSLRVKIENKGEELEEMARKLEVLFEELGEKASKKIEDEVYREIEEALKELNKEEIFKEIEEALEELNEELENMEETETETEVEAEVEAEVDVEAEAEVEVDVEAEVEAEAEAEVEVKVNDRGLGDILDGLDIKFNKKQDELKDVKTRWLLVDLGFASYVAPDPLPEINGISPMEPDILNSVSWRLHVMNQRINIARHYLNLIYGVGFSFNYYGFANPTTLLPSSPRVNFTLPDDNNLSFEKNHLRATYLHIPFMLNIETNPYKKSKSFHINAGMYGNVLLGGKTTQKTNDRKFKVKDKYNLETFQYGLLAQIGYGPITFYGTYGLNELFKPEKDNGYRVQPITFGIKILPF